MDKSMLEEMVSVTKGLVAVNSINSNDGGELLASQYIDGYFKKLPYFQEHPEYSFTQELRADALHRRNVFAFVKAGKKRDKKCNNYPWTHGHGWC